MGQWNEEPGKKKCLPQTLKAQNPHKGVGQNQLHRLPSNIWKHDVTHVHSYPHNNNYMLKETSTKK